MAVRTCPKKDLGGLSCENRVTDTTVNLVTHFQLYCLEGRVLWKGEENDGKGEDISKAN